MYRYTVFLFAFLCIWVDKQVFCGSEYGDNHDDHDHEMDDPPTVPIIFHNPGVFPIVPIPTTKNPYIFVSPTVGSHFHNPNDPNFNSNGNAHQHDPNFGGTQRIPSADNQYGDNNYNNNQNNQFGNSRNPNNNGDPKYGQTHQQNNGYKGDSSYQLSAAYPEGCELRERQARGYCKLMVKLIPNKNKPNHVTFELSGKSSGYIAVGLSEDRLMGDDHIIECVRRADGNFEHYQSFSKRQLKPERIKDDTKVVNNFHYEYKDGYMSCSFDRYVKTGIKVNNKEYIYNLSEGRHHVLLAMGDLKDSTTDEIGYHGREQRYASEKSVSQMVRTPYYYNSGNNIINYYSSSSSILTIISLISMYAIVLF